MREDRDGAWSTGRRAKGIGHGGGKYGKISHILCVVREKRDQDDRELVKDSKVERDLSGLPQRRDVGIDNVKDGRRRGQWAS